MIFISDCGSTALVGERLRCRRQHIVQVGDGGKRSERPFMVRVLYHDPRSDDCLMACSPVIDIAGHKSAWAAFSRMCILFLFRLVQVLSHKQSPFLQLIRLPLPGTSYTQ
jgi:hypothetical protein